MKTKRHGEFVFLKDTCEGSGNETEAVAGNLGRCDCCNTLVRMNANGTLRKHNSTIASKRPHETEWTYFDGREEN